jgi:aminoglycoside phosphotransferase (APT) family kinase protein
VCTDEGKTLDVTGRDYEAAVGEAIRYHVGEQPTQLVLVSMRPKMLVYRAHFPATTLIFKAPNPAVSGRDGIALEAWCCERARAVGVPAPVVVAVDTSTRWFPTAFLLMEAAAGRRMDTLHLLPVRVRTVLHQIGGHLRALHRCRVDGYGWLDEDHFRRTGAVRGECPTWRACVTEGVACGAAALADAGVLDRSTAATLRDLLARADAVIDAVAEGRLLHGDLGPVHVWVDPQTLRVTSLIDFGDRAAGDPRWDLMPFDWAGSQALLEGYEPDPSARLEILRVVRLYAVMQAVPWASESYARGDHGPVDILKATIRAATELSGYVAGPPTARQSLSGNELKRSAVSG